MKKKTCLVLTVILAGSMLAGCKKKAPSVPNGIYYNVTGASIEIQGHSICMRNLDLSEIESNLYEKNALGKAENNLPEGESLPEEVRKEICDKIDLEKQFIDEYQPVDFQEEEGVVGIYSEVFGSDLFLYIEYYAKEKTLIFDEMQFVLSK